MAAAPGGIRGVGRAVGGDVGAGGKWQMRSSAPRPGVGSWAASLTTTRAKVSEQCRLPAVVGERGPRGGAIDAKSIGPGALDVGHVEW
jgi:hypothetical protein